MKIPLAKISTPAFVGGFRTLRKSRFGRAEAWAVYRTGEQIDRELERYFAIRKEIEDRFAQTDGKNKFIPRDSVSAFEQELQDLGKNEVELFLDHKVCLPDDCLIQPDEIGALVEAGIIDSPEVNNVGAVTAATSIDLPSIPRDGQDRKAATQLKA